MLIETAKILNIEKEGIAVEVQAASHCSSCSASSSCGHRLLSKIHPHKSRKLYLATEQFYGEVGELVEVGIEENALLKLSLGFYLIPLISMIVSVLFFDFLGFNEPWLIFVALSGLIVGFLGLGLITWNYKKCLNLISTR